MQELFSIISLLIRMKQNKQNIVEESRGKPDKPQRWFKRKIYFGVHTDLTNQLHHRNNDTNVISNSGSCMSRDIQG